MGRRMMSRQVTKTVVKVAKMEIQGGKPVAIELPDEIMLGNVKVDRAQRVLDKKYEESVTVLAVLPETQTYEMLVEDFIQVATVVTEDKEVEQDNQ